MPAIITHPGLGTLTSRRLGLRDDGHCRTTRLTTAEPADTHLLYSVRESRTQTGRAGQSGGAPLWAPWWAWCSVA